MKRLKDKVAIITGAAQGMGAAHAKLFVENGAKVVLTDLNEEKGQAFAKELGENAIFIKHNVTSEDEWNFVIEKTVEIFGEIDILVNNAGIGAQNGLIDTTLEEYRRIVDINQVSVFLGMRAVIKSMKNIGRGSIINISSITGLVGGPIGYTDTKFAVRGMSKAAALELAHLNIRVNSVHPGIIETPMIQIEGNENSIQELVTNKVPLKRAAKPEEVSSLVLFLASDESSYSTGSEFVVDGGYTL